MKVVNLTHNEVGVGIRGIGYYVPENKITNEDLSKMVDISDEWITKKIGIKERYICNDNQAASDLAIPAAQMAIKNAGISAEDIDLIIMTTLTPDHSDPMTANLIQHKLGAKNAAAFNMSIGGCPDSIFSIATASQFITSGAYKTVLIVNAEVNSRLINWQDRTTCVIFGDGAGAVLLQATKKGCGILGFTINNDGSSYDVIHVKAGGSRMPASTEALEKRMNFLSMDGRKVWDFAVKVFPESVKCVLDELKINKDDLGLLVTHQANLNIIKKGMDLLGLPMEKTHTTVQKYGNTTSASVPITLAEACELGKVSPGDYVGLCAFGAGLAWGTVVMKWCKDDEFLLQ